MSLLAAGAVLAATAGKAAYDKFLKPTVDNSSVVEQGPRAVVNKASPITPYAQTSPGQPLLQAKPVEVPVAANAEDPLERARRVIQERDRLRNAANSVPTAGAAPAATSPFLRR